MVEKSRTIIKATGSYIPDKVVKNEDFLNNTFYDTSGNLIPKSNEEIIQKFEEITGIKERRYVPDDMVASDISYLAAKDALDNSGIDKETIDYIIVAHNFGDIRKENPYSDFVPSIAARVKSRLNIENPYCVATDLPFGCPGWLQGIIQADFFMKSSGAKRALVIGAETLSRVCDPHDRDSMLYSDGAGATILEKVETDENVGILSHISRSDTKDHAFMLVMGKSYNPDYPGNNLFLKMQGHKLYKYSLQHVPVTVKKSIENAGLTLDDISKVFIHQANEKMDEEILRRLYGLYDQKNKPSKDIYDIMPMTISWLGNSSVATLPTLIDLTRKEKIEGHVYESGNTIVMTSVGAGMNINTVVYRIP